MVMHYVNEAHGKRDWSKVKRILIDETSARRGHRYVTNVVDAETGELLLMVQGKGAETVKEFKEAMAGHGARPEQMEWICMDMSRAFRKGARESFPNAKVVFDRFHVMQMVGAAIDAIRRRLQALGANLKGGRWALLSNEENKSEGQKAERYRLCKLYPALGRALGLRDALQDILSLREGASLKWWCGWALRSRLPEFEALARTVKEHWDGILGFCETGHRQCGHRSGQRRGPSRQTHRKGIPQLRVFPHRRLPQIRQPGVFPPNPLNPLKIAKKLIKGRKTCGGISQKKVGLHPIVRTDFFH